MRTQDQGLKQDMEKVKGEVANMQSEADLKMTRVMNSRFEKVFSKDETNEKMLEQFKDVAELIANEKKEANKRFEYFENHLVISDVEFTENSTFKTLGELIQDMLNKTDKNFNTLKKKLADDRMDFGKKVLNLHDDMEKALMEKVAYLENN